jgi:hypothetical protein
MNLTLHRFKKRLLASIDRIADAALFSGIVLIAGFGSSWYMVEAGSLLSTRNIGPWMLWTSAARADADPYTRAHFARLGALPMSSEVSLTYFATVDNEGRRLHSSCDYVLEGKDLPRNWWSLTVFDDRGRLITNPVDRHTFTSTTIALQPNGSYVVMMARDARPGNWLPTGGAGRIALVFNVLDLGLGSTERETLDEQSRLPAIKRENCR